MNRKTLIALVIIIIALVAGFFYYHSIRNTETAVVNNPNNTSITYVNTDYGFNFTLPSDWQGYSIVKETWNGNALTDTVASSGPKLLIRNPKWIASAPYEDLPILVFTISQ